MSDSGDIGGVIDKRDEKPKEEVKQDEKKEEVVAEKKEKVEEKEIARMAFKLVGQLKKQGAELKAARALGNTGGVNPAGEGVVGDTNAGKVIENKDSSAPIAETVPVQEENLKEKPKEEAIEEKKEEVVQEKKQVVEEKKEKIEIARFANKLVGQLKKQGAELKAAKALNAAGSEKNGNEE